MQLHLHIYRRLLIRPHGERDAWPQWFKSALHFYGANYDQHLLAICLGDPSLPVKRQIFVTADDFGSSPEVNSAVIRAYKEGILRYASLLVDAPAAKAAAELARQNPGLGVGLHLNLCGSNPALYGLKYFFLPSWRKGLEPEIKRQMEKLKSFGIKPTHADGHINIHIHPVIFPKLLRLCRKYNIPRVRIPAGEYGLGMRYLKKVSLGSRVEYAAFWTLGNYLKKKAETIAPEIKIFPRSFGLLRSGRMKEDYVLWLLENLPKGETEIYFHPSLDPDSRVAGERPTPSHQTLTEFETLTSPRILEALKRLAVSLSQREP